MRAVSACGILRLVLRRCDEKRLPRRGTAFAKVTDPGKASRRSAIWFKKTIYRIQDNLFHFWYRFIPKCRFQIAMGLASEAFESRILPYLNDYFGLIFEEICMQYILRKTAERKIEVIYEEYGKWWGANPRKKCQEEVDIVAVSNTDILAGECKWKSDPVGYDVFNTLVERADLIRKNRNIQYMIFSRAGFETKLEESGERNLTLVDLDMLLS